MFKFINRFLNSYVRKGYSLYYHSNVIVAFFDNNEILVKVLERWTKQKNFNGNIRCVHEELPSGQHVLYMPSVIFKKGK